MPWPVLLRRVTRYAPPMPTAKPATITLSCGHSMEEQSHTSVPGIPGTMQVQHTCPTCGSVEVKSRAATLPERQVNAERDVAREHAERTKREDEPTTEVGRPATSRASARAPR